MLKSISANAHVTEIHKLGKFRNGRKKQKAVLVTLAKEHEARVTLVETREFSNNLVERKIDILSALTKDDALK